jgi:organic hydroperoxide reductase OsmC/OhrA
VSADGPDAARAARASPQARVIANVGRTDGVQVSQYRASIKWQRNGAVFTDNRYSREHVWKFDGVEVPASASPQVVPLPLSIEQAIDPEEAFVAALASCHMLWFLAIAAKRGFVVESYRDEATGLMAKNPDGKLAMTQVTLYPKLGSPDGSPATSARLQRVILVQGGGQGRGRNERDRIRRCEHTKPVR